MNKIYALKYCYITNTVKVVSELARRVCKGSTRRGKRLSVLTSLALSALLPTVAGASTVGGNNPYQTYRDFAENKGQFQAGATNIPIFNNKGELVGHLDKAPMVDFSSVNVSSNPGVATLINPQYIASVKHNKGYQSVSFGDGQNSYHIVDRNEHSSSDLHTPRLDKLVTEVAPATVTSSSTADILNPSKYSAFYRAGSGSQYIQDSQGKRHWVTGGYGYLTGGILPTSFFYHGSDGIQLYMGGNIHDHSILPSFGEAGDSGSPLFGWNTAKGQWELVGVYSGVGGGTNLIYSLIPQSFLSQIYSEDNDAPVFFNASSGAPLQWKFDSSTGTGSLKQGSDEYAMHGQKGSDLNAGKNLTFLGHNGQIDLENSVTQGAGSLTLYIYNNPYTHTVDYFILKTSSYGWFPTGQVSNEHWEYVGHDQNSAQALLANRINNKGYLYHGKLLGNINFSNKATPGTTGALVMDGSANMSGTFTQENGRLTIQGHPVIHASTSQSIANTVSSLGDNSVLTQPTSFTQDDWENRTFSFGSLVLKDTDFGLGRNATLNTTIQADNSSVTLGDSRVFIDKKDGQGTAFTLEEGTSVATKDADKSVFNGTVNLDNQSVLNINDIFNGGIQANNSTVNISSDSAILGNSTLTSTALNLNKGANALASQSFVSDGPVNISDATLSLNSRPDEVSHTLLPVYDYAGSWNLKGDDARLNVGPYSMLSGNINVQDKGTVTLGGEGELSPDLTLQNQMLYSLFNGYRNTWSGSLNAPDATVSMTDTQWSMNGNSTAGNMKLNRTIVGFNGGTSSFTTLTTDNLDAVQSAFVMRTDLNKADKLVINKSATGHDNSIWVNFLKKPSDKDTLDIPLVSAPEATADNLFRASTRVVGFSDVTPTLSVRKEDGKKEWVLDGYQVARNDGQGKAAATFMHISYNNFITEVNNLNKRMGDLRDINGEAGTWVRLLNGSGSADGGFTDHYTLLQMGADRKHELGSMDLFTGVMATYTDTDASAGLYSGKTKSWGGGFYASGLFRSGAYFDLIAKYIHNENKYDLNFAGAGKQNFRSHSLYAGAEVGYRYHLTDTTFVEPQAELVWGRLQGQTFNWNDSGMDVSMRRNSVNPLVGRTGVVSGKTFSGKDWSLTARAGLHYEFDLTDSADVHLKDAAGEHQINGRKDGRMLYGVGLNARFGDNTRLGLEVERSAFGKYNTDDAINANIRYSF